MYTGIKRNIIFKAACFLAATALLGWSAPAGTWLQKNKGGYSVHYMAPDRNNINGYNKFLHAGVKNVQSFFQQTYPRKFDVYIHPNRHSLDSAWQKDWGMPDFKSECWMVASGIAAKLDIISPAVWTKEACEHNYIEKDKTQQLITHELVHVLHGQLNASPDFSNTEGIDWFVEGLATYASGQCDSSRIANVMKAIKDNKVPESLADFWKGELKYGLSGSVVMFIDAQYGRHKLIELLPFSKESEILKHLNIDEKELLKEWKDYMQKKFD